MIDSDTSCYLLASRNSFRLLIRGNTGRFVDRTPDILWEMSAELLGTFIIGECITEPQPLPKELITRVMVLKLISPFSLSPLTPHDLVFTVVSTVAAAVLTGAQVGTSI